MIVQIFQFALPVTHLAIGLLAQAGGSTSNSVTKKASEFERIATALGMLALAVAVLVVIALYIRKKLLSPDDEEKGIGFTIGELRDMHKEGAITDVEFDRAKRAIVSQNLNRINEKDYRES